MLFIGLIICTLGFLSLSLVNSLPMLYVVIVVGIVLGSSLGYNMPISVLIAKVFHERRSLAFGIFRMGPGISGPLVPLVGWTIGVWGWRTAAVASACIIFLTGLPLAMIIKRIYDRRSGEIRDRSWRQSGDPATALLRSAVYSARSPATSVLLVAFSRHGAAPHGYRRGIGSFRYLARRPRLEHGGSQWPAWTLRT